MRNHVDKVSLAHHRMEIECILTWDYVVFCAWHFSYSTWEECSRKLANVFIKSKVNAFHLIKHVACTIAGISRSLDFSRLVLNEVLLDDSDNWKDKNRNNFGDMVLEGWLMLSVVRIESWVRSLNNLTHDAMMSLSGVTLLSASS